MNILHVITTLDVGGAEMHLLSQVRGQVRGGHRVRVSYLKGNGTLAADFRQAGAERVDKVGVSLALPARLWGHLRWSDIVHSHLLKADVAAALVATVAGRRRRLVSGKHNDEQILKHPLVSRVHGWLGRLPAATVVLSDHVGRFVERYGRVPLHRQRRIYYGVDPGPFEAAAALGRGEKEAIRAALGIGRSDIVFICVARFAPQKAHDVLLGGFAQALAARRPDDSPLRLVLVGDDPFGDGRRRAENLARELELGLHVVFTGVRRDVPELLAASDVFVMSSLWEGLGLVFLEAMAAKLPVLATRVSAVPEVVLDGFTGVLVPAGEREGLAQAMLALARDPLGRARMGEAGRLRVREHFGYQRMVDETLALYGEICSR